MLVDPQTFYKNLLLILSGVVLLGVLFVVAMVAITLIRAWLWARARRKAEEKWLKYCRRADGRTYPPTVVGACDDCGRGGSHIYAEYGKFLCALCYEKVWREKEGWGAVDEESSTANAAQNAQEV